MAFNFTQGYYTPKHPEKYVGDVNKIRFLSSWELEFNKFLDNNINVLRWSSEEVVIPYVKPTDNRVHRYFPDYWVEFKRGDNIVQEIIEVKPHSQVMAPKPGRKRKKTQLYEQITYAVNVAKWQAATEFCKKRGIQFRIVTENSLFK